MVLLARSPRENSTLVVQGKNVVVATCQVFDFLQRRDQSRDRLDLVTSIKAQDTIITLDVVSEINHYIQEDFVP